jgi:anti-sigma factor RsiW
MVQRPLDESDLHAYIDGRLSVERRLRVEAWLAGDAAAAERAAHYRAQVEALHLLFDPVLHEPEPPSIAKARARLEAGLAEDRRRRWLRSPPVRAAAAVALLVTGMAAGYAARPGAPVSAPPFYQSLADEAVRFHGQGLQQASGGGLAATDTGRLNGWLSERLGHTVSGPNFAQEGYRLVGGRLLPTSGDEGIQLVYEGPNRKLVTLLVASPAADVSADAFSYVRRDGVSSFAWVEGRLAYVLAGPVERDVLLGLARIVHRAFEAREAKAVRQAGTVAPTGAM